MTLPNENLERSLSESGVTWELIPDSRHQSLEADWQNIYRIAFVQPLRMKTGVRAQEAYATEIGGDFFVVPFLGNVGGFHAIGKRGPRTAAYLCHAEALPDLSALNDLDFFIAAADLSWTMIHTHEDFELGGPYFIRKEWLLPPTRKREW